MVARSESESDESEPWLGPTFLLHTGHTFLQTQMLVGSGINRKERTDLLFVSHGSIHLQW